MFAHFNLKGSKTASIALHVPSFIQIPVEILILVLLRKINTNIFGRKIFLFFRQVVVGWTYFSSYGLKVDEIYIDYIGKIWNSRNDHPKPERWIVFFLNCKKNNYLTCFHILKNIYMGRCSVFLAIWKITEILYTFLYKNNTPSASPSSLWCFLDYNQNYTKDIQTKCYIYQIHLGNIYLFCIFMVFYFIKNVHVWSVLLLFFILSIYSLT